MPEKSSAAKPRAQSSGNAKLIELMNDAGVRLNQGDYGSAIRLYREALALAPDSAGAAMGLAMVLNRTGNAVEACQWLDRLSKSVGKLRSKESVPFRAAVWAQLGLSKQLLGQITPALLAFEKAAKLMPTTDLEIRIKQLRPLASSPEPVQQLILRARQLITQDQAEGAIKAFEAALQLHPDSTEALHGLAMLQRQRGQLATALPLLQKAIVLAPNRPEFFNDAGMIFQDRGDFAQAVSFHKRALKVDPNFSWALINLGVAHKRLGQNEEALAAYQRALQIDPNTPETHNNLGNLLRLMGRLSEARSHLQQALALRPSYADAQANLQAVDTLLAQQLAESVALPRKPKAKPIAAAKITKTTKSAKTNT